MKKYLMLTWIFIICPKVLEGNVISYVINFWYEISNKEPNNQSWLLDGIEI